jgi:hypothetical protein
MNHLSALLPKSTTYQQAHQLASDNKMNLYEAHGRFLVTNLPPMSPWKPRNPISTEKH